MGTPAQLIELNHLVDRVASMERERGDDGEVWNGKSRDKMGNYVVLESEVLTEVVSLNWMAGKLTDHSAIGVNDLVYIFGGGNENGTVLNQVLKYDPTLHTYTAMAPMPTPRYRMGATLLDSKFSPCLPWWLSPA